MSNFHYRNFLLLIVTLFFTLFIIKPGAVLALTDAPSDSPWVTDGQVKSIVRANNKTYIGGYFTYVGPNSGQIAAFNTTTHQLTTKSVLPFTGYYILDSVSDGNGGWFVTGYFTVIQGVNRAYVAHILSDGTVDPNWSYTFDGRREAIATSPDNSIVYVGGSYSLVALNATNGNLIASWSPTVTGQVKDIATDGNYVYIGGNFTQVNGATRNSIAVLSPATGAAATLDASWVPSITGGTPNVDELVVASDALYVVGKFTTVNGSATFTHAAALEKAGSGRTGAATAWKPAITAGIEVTAIAISGSDAYIGGNFSSVSGTARTYLAKTNRTTGALDATWNPTVVGDVGTVYGLAINPDLSTIYAVGGFSTINGLDRYAMAELNLTDGAPTNWKLTAIPGDSLSNVNYSNGVVFFSGNNESIGGTFRDGVARLNNTGQADDWSVGTITGSVNTLVADANNLYIGGDISMVNGTESAGNLIAVDLDDGTLQSFRPIFDYEVLTLHRAGTNLYVGGYFNVADSEQRNCIAKFDLGAGTLAGFDAGLPSYCEVDSIATAGSTVFVAGDYATVNNGVSKPYLAGFNAATGTTTAWDPQADDWTFSVMATDTTLYVGGYFASIGGDATQQYAAAFNLSDMTLSNWDPQVDDGVYTFAPHNSEVVLGGLFYQAGGQNNSYLASVDATTGLATSWSPLPDDVVNTAIWSGDSLLIGGSFYELGSTGQYPRRAYGQFGDAQDGDTPTDSTPDPSPTPTPTPTATPIPATTVTSNSTSGSSGSNNPGSTSTECTETKPATVVDLFQIKTAPTEMTLYFTPAKDADRYLVTYTQVNKKNFAVFVTAGDPNGVQVIPIRHLLKSTEYQVAVQPFKDCAAGPLSNQMTVLTPKKGSAVAYKNQKVVSKSTTNKSTVLGTTSKQYQVPSSDKKLDQPVIASPAPTPQPENLPTQPVRQSWFEKIKNTISSWW